MANWTCLKNDWTPVTVADTTNFTAAGFMALQGGTSTQVVYVSKVYIGGLATVQSPMALLFAVDSTVGVTSLTGVLSNPTNRSASTLSNPALAFSSASTLPQRSSTVQLWAPAMNAFGGIAVMSALDPDHRISLLGNVANAGELSLSCSAGTPGVISSHWEYEII